MDILNILGIKEINYGATTGKSDGLIKTKGVEIVSNSPIDGKPIAKVVQATADDYEEVVRKAEKAFLKWRMMPAPKRGEIVREIGTALREYKEPLAKLVTLEMGKIVEEGYGEVQEMIDVADFALGLSRQLYGRTMHSERYHHRMYEQWHPLGIVGIITSFNFPVSVWSWNTLIAGICGDVNIWKPSSKTPLSAIAVQNIIAPIIDKHGIDGVFNLVIGGGKDIGDRLVADKRIPLISATGSCEMGRAIGQAVAKRLGRSLLELGGNNAIIITENADLNMALKATLFGAIGTAGQRCTSTRRIIVHKSVKKQFIGSLVDLYKNIKIGNPMNSDTIMGPVLDQGSIDAMLSSIKEAGKEGGKVLYGGNRLTIKGLEDGFYIEPAIMEVKNEYKTVQNETFAPLLYIIEYNTIEEAISIQNDVPQGLSSAIFTKSLHYSEAFLSHLGSDCGIANVNIGTSGAEIGGAFGGEKDTGGGRESGSDSWKYYMRQQTNTINWGDSLSFAQGINFKVN